MKKLLLLSFVFTFMCKAESQSDLNNYKYAVVPLQYEFLKGKDIYRLNTLTRVLFKEQGFKTYFNEEQLPEDLFKDRCLAVYADVKKVKAGPFKKKVQLIIKDCKGEIIHESDIGDSKENNHQKAYNEALRKAFKSVERLNYNYTPQTKPIKENREEVIVTSQVPIKIKDNVEQVKIEDNLDKKKILKDASAVIAVNNNSLVVKSISMGFEVLDSDLNIVMTLLKTAVKNVFIVKGKDAIVFKEDNKWMYSENDGTSSILKALDIKF